MIRGIGRTGRLVTSAALILFLAFVSLASGPETEIKVLATGLAAGILLDATVIRALLVPAASLAVRALELVAAADARQTAARRAIALATSGRPGGSRGLGVSVDGRMGDNGIEVEGLVRDFKGGVRAVDGIDLRVAPGEIYGFLGPNGAGKSTTVLMLTTLLPPTAGSARVAGLDVVRQGAEVRRAIGASLQESALDPFADRTRAHAAYRARCTGCARAMREQRGRELLERVGLTDAADRKVGGYSGGMKRRLDLGLALVHHPRLLFLDEPTTGLDPQSRAALWDEVRRLAGDGVTVFLTTQYLEEADVLADRVGIIDRGTIVAEGTPAELKAAIGRPSVEAVPQDPGERERLADALRRFGEDAAAAPGAVAVRLPDGRRRPGGDHPYARQRGPDDRRPAPARADARRRVPGQDRPLAGGRGRRRGRQRG